jgi:hypothetical protein
MSLEDSIHKKMFKVVLWKMAWLDKLDELQKEGDDISIIDSVKESAKPRIRWIKEFFLLWLKEMRRDFKKTKRNNKQ